MATESASGHKTINKCSFIEFSMNILFLFLLLACFLSNKKYRVEMIIVRLRMIYSSLFFFTTLFCLFALTVKREMISAADDAHSTLSSSKLGLAKK